MSAQVQTIFKYGIYWPNWLGLVPSHFASCITIKKQHRNIGANGKWRVTPKYQIWHHEVPFPFARFKNKLNLEHIWTRPLTGQVKPTRLYFTGTMLALSFFFSRKIYVLPGQDNHVWPFEYYASVWIKRQSALELILRALCLFFGTLLFSSYPKHHGNTSAVIAGVFVVACHIGSVVRAITLWHTLLKRQFYSIKLSLAPLFCTGLYQ